MNNKGYMLFGAAVKLTSKYIQPKYTFANMMVLSHLEIFKKDNVII